MIDKDQMHTWLTEAQLYPASGETANRAARMLERTKAGLERLAPGSMFDTEPAGIFTVLAECAGDE